MTTAKGRRDGLVLVLLGAVVFLSIGIAWRRVALVQLGDFKVVYYSARCLLEHGDPYNERDVERVYDAEGRERPTEAMLDRQVKTRFFYPPTAFALTVPVAGLGFRFGALVWTVLMAGGLIVASLAVWDLAADKGSTASGALAGLLLMNSFWLYMIGNSAGIAVSLCVVAVWTFFRKRLEWAGVLCLALSLAVKPNDSGLIWLLLILAGGTYRKRALQSVAVIAVFGLPVIFWVSRTSGHWLTELQANMASFAGIGGIVDPAATGMAGRNMDSLVQLQTAISIFFARPGIYNLIVYAICAPLVLIWIWTALRARWTADEFWLALAAAAPLTLLPTYHFQHDAKLLLLAIPGCTMLWMRRGRLGWAALILTTAGIIINGDIFTAVKVSLTRNILVPQPHFMSRFFTVLLTRPSGLILLAMSMLFLWAFVREGRSREPEGKPVTEPEPSQRGETTGQVLRALETASPGLKNLGLTGCVIDVT
jgi:hypothetical protein